MILVAGLCLLVADVDLLPPLLGDCMGLPVGGDRPGERLWGDAFRLPADELVLLEVVDCRMGTVLERRGPELVVFGREGSGDIDELFIRKVLSLDVAVATAFVVQVMGLEVALAVEDFIRNG